ncbi:hypothetical protein GLOIN_2v1772633 [Rhizophagus irregularis DAOM 181602=DAOM 197198]|nr:hypothetical protein GLOIN_2v1772633 [Rhizophagus irregularis DAOM 181602=DAOM 197198]
MQRHAQDAINLQGQLNTAHNLLNNANGRINNFINDMANVRNECLRRAQLLTIAYNNEANERHRWWQIAQERQTNGQRMAFRKQNQINILVREKAVLQILARSKHSEYGRCKPTLGPQLAFLLFYDGQEEPDSYYAKLRTINESARPLAVAGFNAAARANVMKGKMTGRFHPVPANDPYTAGNPAINTEPLFLAWLQGRYREIMVGTNRDALRGIMNEKFTAIDTADTYEKRVKPYVQGISYADAIEYLYGHMPQYMEMRFRQANPANLDAFFTDLQRIWLESRGRIAEQQPSPSQTLAIQPQKDSQAEHDFIVRLTKDLDYLGVATNLSVLGPHIYDELGKRLGHKTAHVRKSPFTPKSIYTTKKVIKKIVPKKSSKLPWHCSVCAKAGHIKVNCPRVKRTKKVNHVYQDVEKDSEDSEEECIAEEKDESEEEEIEDDDENDDDDSPLIETAML